MIYDKLNKEQNKAWLNDLKNYFRMIHETSRCHMFINILDLMANTDLVYTEKLDDEITLIKVDGVNKFWMEKKTHPNNESCYTVFIQDDEIGKTIKLLRYYPHRLISWDEEFSEDDIIVHNECFDSKSKTNRVILDKIGKVLEISKENDNAIDLYNVRRYLNLLEAEIKNKWRIIRVCDSQYLVEFNDNPDFKIIIYKDFYQFFTLDMGVKYFDWSLQTPDLTLEVLKHPNDNDYVCFGIYKNRFDLSGHHVDLKNSYEVRRLILLLSEIKEKIQREQ